MNQPLITVVTVSYNAVLTIEETILSVINQKYSQLEYIIIDGGSTDGTVDIIKKYADKITYWISEPDRGIYDAMNKGIIIANGEWINFMNSGDIFVNNQILCLFEQSNPVFDVDVIYGDRISKYSFGRYLHKVDKLKCFENHFPLFHQSVFVKTEWMKKYKFNLQYRICGDYDFLLKLYRRGSQFHYIPICISECDSETGVSTLLKNEITRIKEDELLKKSRLTFSSYYFIVKAGVRYRIRMIVKYFFPFLFSPSNLEKRLLKDSRMTKLPK